MSLSCGGRLLALFLTAAALGGPSFGGGAPFPGGPGSPIGGGLPPLSEPSGAVWHFRLQKLLVVSDNGQLMLLDPDGSALSSLVVPGDLEGVCVADSTTDLVYVGVENPASVSEVNLVSGEVLRMFVLLTDVPINLGLEALTFVPDPAHPEGGLFYAGIQADGTIHVFELPIKSSSTATTATEVDLIMPAQGLTDLSGLHYDRQTDVLYAIFDDANLWRAMQTDGTLIDEWLLPGVDQEGVAIGPCSLFIAEDSGGLWNYPYPLAPGDADDDGLADCEDNCPQADNAGQTDTDGDGYGDACDDDDDQDGVADADDNCPLVPNPGQADDDQDQVGDVCDPCPGDPTNDVDGDEVCGAIDNCPADPNPDQTDTDGDGMGDACDGDDDGDGIDDPLDNCALISNTGQANSDGDVAGDACDCAPLDGTAWIYPTEVASVVLMRTVTGEIRLLWEGQPATFDVAGGGVDVLAADGGVIGAVCIVEDLVGSFLSDPLPDPPPGQGQYYLVRAQNGCGDGTYGFDSWGGERVPEAACA